MQAGSGRGPLDHFDGEIHLHILAEAHRQIRIESDIIFALDRCCCLHPWGCIYCAVIQFSGGCRVLQVALAGQLGCNPEAITGKEIDALWVPSLGDETIKTSIQEFFQKVDALRYSGDAATIGVLEKEELEIESIIGQLGKKK